MLAFKKIKKNFAEFFTEPILFMTSFSETGDKWYLHEWHEWKQK